MSILLDHDLYTGNDLIDQEHEQLFAAIEKLEESGKAGKEKIVAVQCLDFLMDYTEKHFHDEEELQQRYHYPKIDAHKEQHESFRRAVNELREMLEEQEGPTDSFVKAVDRNVHQWLKGHIEVWDKGLAHHISEHS